MYSLGSTREKETHTHTQHKTKNPPAEPLCPRDPPWSHARRRHPVSVMCYCENQKGEAYDFHPSEKAFSVLSYKHMFKD